MPSVYAGDEFGLPRASRRSGSAATTPVRPEFAAPPMGVDEQGHDVFRLHQYLIGLRRRHPWLHTARTTALRLANRHYVYETRSATTRCWSR